MQTEKNKGPSKEFRELDDFQEFLVKTGRMEYFDNTERGHSCLCLVRDFSALATKNNVSPLAHLHDVDTQQHYKDKRKHALSCERCQMAFDAMFTFEADRYMKEFPQVTQAILRRLADIGLEENLHIVKLPAPTSGTFHTKARLILATPESLYTGVTRFEKSVLYPLGLKEAFGKFDYRKKPLIRGRSTYEQANANYASNHVSIRALTKA